MIDNGPHGDTFIARLGNSIRRLTPMAYRLQRTTRQIARRAMRKPRTVMEGPNLLPLLIQVLAAFSKVDGMVLEEEIDSSLGFLRYDYPEAVYSELRKLFRQALNEQHDLMAMAQKLSTQLTEERKIMLGVQLYDLISKTDTNREQITNFYAFMSAPRHGGAGHRHRLSAQCRRGDRPHASSSAAPRRSSRSASARNGSADVVLRDLEAGERLLVFRYHDVILLKNQTQRPDHRARAPACGGALLPRLFRPAHRPGRAGARLPGPAFIISTQRKTSRSPTSTSSSRITRSRWKSSAPATRSSRCNSGSRSRSGPSRTSMPSSTACPSRPARTSRRRSTTRSSSTTGPSCPWRTSAGAPARSAGASSSRPTRASTWSRTTPACSRRTTSCSPRAPAARSCSRSSAITSTRSASSRSSRRTAPSSSARPRSAIPPRSPMATPSASIPARSCAAISPSASSRRSATSSRPSRCAT